MIYILLVLGFIILLGGAELLVRGAVSLAKSFNISKLVIGMTVIAFGTSSPELIVSINASVSGVPSLALGNLVGSNIANILLILGVSGLIYPIKSENKSLWLDWVVLTFASSLFIIFSLNHSIDFNDGILLIGIFIIFMIYSYLRGSGYLSGANLGDDKTPGSEVEELSFIPQSKLNTVIFVFMGFAGLAVGSELLIDNGVQIARSFQISEVAIGLTVIAIGTSLPELAASGVAAFRKETDLAFGNIVGSNIFNIVGIVGLMGLIDHLEIPSRVLQFDMWVMFFSVILLLPFMFRWIRGLGRAFASMFLLLYLLYIFAIANDVKNIFDFGSNI